MYKTAVDTLVIGVITHQKPQISAVHWQLGNAMLFNNTFFNLMFLMRNDAIT